ncbi:MAG: acetyl-CoA C-acyltransferase [Saprospiraceae bacterium]|nr:acetyl-CoA C-acyltransferase [Candidatus Defluviibacterium haderslevense]
MDTFIIDGTRSPIGSLGGSLALVRTDDLAAHSIRSLMNKYPFIDPLDIDDVILGCANQSGEDNRNIARMASLLAGLHYKVAGETINRLCASGMSAVIHAHRAIQTNDGHLFISGGVEGMTRSPWIISKTSSAFGRDSKMYDSTFGWRFINPSLEQQYGCDSMGETAENLAVKYNISRFDQDSFALWSQEKTKNAFLAKRFSKEIAPITIPHGKNNSVQFEKDEFPKPDSTLEKLSSLKPAFRTNGTVTAGNSSGLNDGSAALLIGSSTIIDKYQFKPLAKIISSAVIGTEPKYMGIGPVEASRLALKKANLKLEQMGIIEINEAFASQVLSCTRELGIDDRDDRINPNGGAIALGHPLGMSGSRLILTAAHELHEKNVEFALCTMCIGVGQGYAVIIQRV